MGAAFIHERYGWKYAAPAYLAAAWVGYSRVDEDKHHVEDVIAGAALGIAASFFFTTPYDNVKIIPVAGGDYLGVNISLAW
jgi:membrane-associated phospholipid phosphatase